MNFRLLYSAIFLVPLLSFGQNTDTIYVSNDKTTYVMFADDVDMVDIGNKEYAYNASANMVLFKALKETAKPTSLMVKTKTTVKVWMIAFQKHPKKILIDTRVQNETANYQYQQSQQPEILANSNQGRPTANQNQGRGQGQNQVQNNQGGQQQYQPGYISPEVYNKRMEEKYGKVLPHPSVGVRAGNGNRDAIIHDNLMQQKLYYILSQKKNFKDIGEIEGGLYFSLHDVFVDRNFMYFKVGIHNTTSIAFDLDFMSFERQQGRTFKKREGNSQSLLNLSNRETVFTVAPSTEEVVVYVLELFAFQDSDSVLVKLNELGGVRTLKFTVPAKIITQAKTL